MALRSQDTVCWWLWKLGSPVGGEGAGTGPGTWSDVGFAAAARLCLSLRSPQTVIRGALGDRTCER